MSVTVVGYDGSELAKAALDYALRRAGPSDAVVAATAISPPAEFIETPYYERSVEPLREHAQRLLGEIDRERFRKLSFETAIVEGPAARSLVEVARARDAVEIVVGSRGFGRFRAALGSTSHALLHETDRPTVVVPRAALERQPEGAREGRAVLAVVGYDGSENGRAALRYAVERARRSPCGLLVVRAYDAPSHWLGTPYFEHSLFDNQERGREVLAEVEALAGEVHFEAELLAGAPAEVLTRAAQARDGDEIIVGSRGFGRFRAALGSTSHALLHMADRPLVVVPPRATRDLAPGVDKA